MSQLMRLSIVMIILLYGGMACAEERNSEIGPWVAAQLAEATSITIFHTPSDQMGGLAYRLEDVESLALVTLSLRCRGVCSDDYRAIRDIFLDNEFIERACGRPYSTLLRLDGVDARLDLYIGSEGHCLYVHGKTYMVESGLLNGIIASFPTFERIGQGYGLEGFRLSDLPETPIQDED